MSLMDKVLFTVHYMKVRDTCQALSLKMLAVHDD